MNHQKNFIWTLLLGILFQISAFSQSERVFELGFDNDTYLEMDHYYTNGLYLGYYSDQLHGNPINRLLLELEDSHLYGLELYQKTYTPIAKESDTVVLGDRPFSAILSVRSSKISDDKERRRRLWTSLDLGLVGKDALGNKVQNAIHDLLPTSNPVDGWEFVQPTSVGINYNLAVEQEMISSNWYEFRLGVGVESGSIRSAANGKAYLRMGKLTHWLDYVVAPRHGWQVYVFGSAQADLVLYDATLQGGWFSQGAENKIAANELNRMVGSVEYGLSFQIRRFSADLSVQHIGSEFEGAQSHAWGHLSFKYQFGNKL